MPSERNMSFLSNIAVWNFEVARKSSIQKNNIDHIALIEKCHGKDITKAWNTSELVGS